MMELKVLLFAQARQVANADNVIVTVEGGATVADLKDALATAYPDLKDLLSRSSIAVDQKYAVEKDVIEEDSEVAMIPPVSGG